jgi:hypothetical protein
MFDADAFHPTMLEVFVSSGIASTSYRRPSPLTLGQIMVAVAILAAAFAFLPWELSGPFAVAVAGILGIRGLRLPLVTDPGGVRRWFPWVLWCLALAACPLAIAVVGTVCERTGPPAFTGPRPWPTRVVDALCYTHLWVSVIASMSVVLLLREGRSWIGWGAIIVIGVFTAFVALSAVMSTTGVYL